jgi:hypothetical protein
VPATESLCIDACDAHIAISSASISEAVVIQLHGITQIVDGASGWGVVPKGWWKIHQTHSTGERERGREANKHDNT